MTGPLSPSERGKVVDTTADPELVPIRVDAVLAAPTVGMPANPLHLDGPLAWGAFVEFSETGGQLPPMSADQVEDFRLPLATWTAAPTGSEAHPLVLNSADEAWGWACSVAEPVKSVPTIAAVRRMPAMGQMADHSHDRSHHPGYGPRRAVNATHEARAFTRASWWAMATDPDRVQALLDRVTNLGRLARHGWGQVREWSVDVDTDAAHRWKRRAFPDPDGPLGTIRAPYHHRSRRMPVTPEYAGAMLGGRR